MKIVLTIIHYATGVVSIIAGLTAVAALLKVSHRTGYSYIDPSLFIITGTISIISAVVSYKAWAFKVTTN